MIYSTIRRHLSDASTVLAVLGLVLASPSCAAKSDSTETGTPQAEEEMLFLVKNVDGPMVPGAEVVLVSGDGIQELGRTNELGALEVPLSQLQVPEAHAVLICAQYSFCGAFRLDTPSFFEAKEHLIALAPFTIR